MEMKRSTETSKTVYVDSLRSSGSVNALDEVNLRIILMYVQKEQETVKSRVNTAPYVE